LREALLLEPALGNFPARRSYRDNIFESLFAWESITGIVCPCRIGARMHQHNGRETIQGTKLLVHDGDHQASTGFCD
jgi:hypothetical protein